MPSVGNSFVMSLSIKQVKVKVDLRCGEQTTWGERTSLCRCNAIQAAKKEEKQNKTSLPETGF